MTAASFDLSTRTFFNSIRIWTIAGIALLLVGCASSRTEDPSNRSIKPTQDVNSVNKCAWKQSCSRSNSCMSTTELLSRSVAGLNGLATIFLIAGYICIRRGNRAGHGKAMGLAFMTSALFLAVYLASKVHLWVSLGRTNIMYRPDVGLTWDKLLYYVILFPHIILAILVTPFIIRAVMLARAGRFEEHKRLTRWVFPVWLYVSITGVIVWAFMECSGSLAAVTAIK